MKDVQFSYFVDIINLAFGQKKERFAHDPYLVWAGQRYVVLSLLTH